MSKLPGRRRRSALALADLRQRLRPLFTSSVIGDGQAYVRAVEQQYRELWQRWCVGQDTEPHDRASL